MTAHPLVLAGWTEAMLALAPTPTAAPRAEQKLARVRRRDEIRFYLDFGHIAYEDAPHSRSARVALRIMRMREREEEAESPAAYDYVLTARERAIDDWEDDERQADMWSDWEPSRDPEEVD